MLERATLIMEGFGGLDACRSLEVVAAETGLPRSTTHRILDQLVRLQWLKRSALGGYSLGRRTVNLSGARDIEFGVLRGATAPLLRKLARNTGLTVLLGIVANSTSYIIDRLEGGEATDLRGGQVGNRLPAHCTAIGKAILAELSPEVVDATYRWPLERMTDSSIASLIDLHRDLSRVRDRAGVAFESQECFPGIWGAAAAVAGPSQPVGAIAILGPSQQTVARVAPAVLQTARVAARDFAVKMRSAQTAVRTEPTAVSLPIRAGEEWLEDGPGCCECRERPVSDERSVAPVGYGRRFPEVRSARMSGN